MGGGRVESLSREKSSIYLRRARNLLSAADEALESENADGAALDAIHATVAACDAITVNSLGLRSTAQSHTEIVGLAARAGAPESLLTQVRVVLSKKTQVEYEARETTLREAEALAKVARRVLTVAVTLLGPYRKPSPKR
jgi:hypothetical protein